MKMRGRKVPKWEMKGLWAALAAAASGGVALTEGVTPLAPAMLCACLAAGVGPAYALTGMALGAALWGKPALLVCGAACAVLHWLVKKGPAELRAGLCGMTGGGICALLEGANWAASAGCAALAGAAAPVLVCGWQVTGQRRILTPEEKLSLAAIGAAALAGLCASPAGRLPGQGAAALLALCASREGASSGALAGLVAGACAAGPEGAAVLGLGGGAAGVLRGMKRPFAAAGMAAAVVLWCMLLGRWDGSFLCMSGAGLLAALAMPEKYVRLLGLWTRPGPDNGDRRRLKAARRSVRAMGDALMECARACQSAEITEGGNTIVSVMRERLCEGCGDYARCWGGGAPEAGRLFTYLSAQVIGGGPLEPLPPDQVRFCRRSPHMTRRLSGIFAAAEQRRSAERERILAARMSAAPLEKAAGLLRALDRQLGRGREDEYAAETAQGTLDRWGVGGLWSVTAAPEMAAELCAGPEISGDRVRQVAGLFSQALGGRYVPLSADRYVREPSIQVAAGMCSREASPGSPCGDRALCEALGDGRTALILSDGMGRGADAAGESRCVATLLHRLLLAGAEARSAIDAVNSMMRLRGGDSFATLDLCLIDAYRSEASFYKLGASLSVLVRRGVCLRVEGGRLPPGVVEPAEPSVTALRLRPGDAVVMVTDGVADFAREGQEDWLTRTLTGLRGTAARAMAERLVDAAARREGGKPRDDMTAVCALIR